MIKKEKKVESIIRQGFGYKNLDKLDLEEKEILHEFEEKHKYYKNVIKEILEYYPLATNNDFILYVEFLRVLDLCQVTSGKDNFVFKIPRNKIKFVPSPESCTRGRRSLNQIGIGLPTNLNVFKKRMKRQRVLRQYFREEKFIQKNI